MFKTPRPSLSTGNLYNYHFRYRESRREARTEQPKYAAQKFNFAEFEFKTWQFWGSSYLIYTAKWIVRPADTKYLKLLLLRLPEALPPCNSSDCPLRDFAPDYDMIEEGLPAAVSLSFKKIFGWERSDPEFWFWDPLHTYTYIRFKRRQFISGLKPIGSKRVYNSKSVYINFSRTPRRDQPSYNSNNLTFLQPLLSFLSPSTPTANYF